MVKLRMDKCRLTLDQCFDGKTLLPNTGVYVLAYMGATIYVGKAASIADRMRQHCAVSASCGLAIDYWLRNMAWDYHNIRIDILSAPGDIDGEQWRTEYEKKLIRKLKPVFNRRDTW